jgi:hypothetical protein
MYIKEQSPECHVCCSTRSETFQQGTVYGRRCLDCGHENKHDTAPKESSGAIFAPNKTKPSF